MVKPSDLNKTAQKTIKEKNNYVLQGQTINTKQTLQEQTKTNDYLQTNNINKQNINISK